MNKNVCYILVFGPHVMEEEVLQNLEPKADVAAQQCVSCMEYPSYVYCSCSLREQKRKNIFQT